MDADKDGVGLCAVGGVGVLSGGSQWRWSGDCKSLGEGRMGN